MSPGSIRRTTSPTSSKSSKDWDCIQKDDIIVSLKSPTDTSLPTRNKKAPILSREAINLFLDNYIPDDEDRKNQLYSSLLWKSGHADLPPSCFQICGQDPLRDEALIFEKILREEHAIPTKVYVYPGQPHG